MSFDDFVVVGVPNVFGERRSHVGHVLLRTDHQDLNESVGRGAMNETEDELSPLDRARESI